jgi:competence protein ComEC
LYGYWWGGSNIKFSLLIGTYFSYFVISILLSVYNNVRDKRAFLRVIDVGQGDALLITTDKGRHIMIDGGDNYEADHYLSHYLPLGLCKIYMTIVSHEHADHSTGLRRSGGRCVVRYPEKELFAGDSFRIDDLSFRVLWPPEGSTFNDINDSSKVVLIKHGEFDALLTGDISKEILCSLDLSSVSGDLEVLKVSHHGSMTGLCKKIIPKIAVISVGKNKFGHPSKEVINFYTENNVTVLTTLEHGTVEIGI